MALPRNTANVRRRTMAMSFILVYIVNTLPLRFVPTMQSKEILHPFVSMEVHAKITMRK